MTNLNASRLSGIYRDIAALRYEHPEGGAYVYVRFLSLLREVPSLVVEQADLDEVGRLQEQLNLALESRFSGEQERFFRESQAAVLGLLRRQLDVVAPLSLSLSTL